MTSNKWPLRIPDAQMSHILHEMSKISAEQSFLNLNNLESVRSKHCNEMVKLVRAGCKIVSHNVRTIDKNPPIYICYVRFVNPQNTQLAEIDFVDW